RALARSAVRLVPVAQLDRASDYGSARERRREARNQPNWRGFRVSRYGTGIADSNPIAQRSRKPRFRLRHALGDALSCGRNVAPGRSPEAATSKPVASPGSYDGRGG